ncbi:hypothetical protein [Hymenobacter terrenus]|uniref:hypothetical protein n=1 Tax=Hymenobacter terrenus TaxID=1629124 RepID=UPI0012E008F9|nr:hypothetical protein [Hymenobacter terrenus]
MKPTPQANYPINVYSHIAENGGSEYYAGIYGIQLNHWLSVCLCPAYDSTAYGFPPDLRRFEALNPDDDVHSLDAARALTIMSEGPLVLLERNEQAGSLIQVIYEQDSNQRWYLAHNHLGSTVGEQRSFYIYCLTSAEYAMYATELEAIMNREFDGSRLEEQPRYYNELENLRRYRVIAHIHELLTTHPEVLSPHEREMLAL